VVFGANVSQTRAIEELQKASQPEPFQRMADHLLRIAGQLFCQSAMLVSFSVNLHCWSASLCFCIAGQLCYVPALLPTAFTIQHS